MSKSNSRANGKSVPAWAKRIEITLKKLGMSRIQFSQELQYSQMAISRWERGIQEPPADCYIKLARLASKPDRWFFLERAGILKEDLQSGKLRPSKGIADFEVVIAGSGKKKII